MLVGCHGSTSTVLHETRTERNVKESQRTHSNQSCHSAALCAHLPRNEFSYVIPRDIGEHHGLVSNAHVRAPHGAKVGLIELNHW